MASSSVLRRKKSFVYIERSTKSMARLLSTSVSTGSFLLSSFSRTRLEQNQET